MTVDQSREDQLTSQPVTRVSVDSTVDAQCRQSKTSSRTHLRGGLALEPDGGTHVTRFIG